MSRTDKDRPWDVRVIDQLERSWYRHHQHTKVVTSLDGRSLEMTFPCDFSAEAVLTNFKSRWKTALPKCHGRVHLRWGKDDKPRKDCRKQLHRLERRRVSLELAQWRS